MKMKRMISLTLILAMVLTLAACGGSGSPTKMTMGTGGTAGTYYAFGGVLGQYIKNHAGIDVTVVSTDGSKANIQGIDAGNYQLGTVQSDVMAYAWEGTRAFEEEGKIDSFRVVAGLYAEYASVYEKIQGASLVDHEVFDLAGELVCVTYSNGVQLCLNYSENDAQVGGVKVPAGSYVVR